MLRDYLERSYGDESVVITERELPIANSLWGYVSSAKPLYTPCR